MSRTKRHIPTWANYQTYLFRKTLLAVGKDFYKVKEGEADGKINPRSKIHFGYDRNWSSSAVYLGFEARGWKEEFNGKTRQFFKRRYHKQARRKYTMKDWLGEY